MLIFLLLYEFYDSVDSKLREQGYKQYGIYPFLMTPEYNFVINFLTQLTDNLSQLFKMTKHLFFLYE
jgi:hypothetical protein